MGKTLSVMQEHCHIQPALKRQHLKYENANKQTNQKTLIEVHKSQKYEYLHNQIIILKPTYLQNIIQMHS